MWCCTQPVSDRYRKNISPENDAILASVKALEQPVHRGITLPWITAKVNSWFRSDGRIPTPWHYTDVGNLTYVIVIQMYDFETR